MKLKPLAEATMWLPGFGPEEDPLNLKLDAGIANLQHSAPVLEAMIGRKVLSIMRTPKPATAMKTVWPGIGADTFDGLSSIESKIDANIAAIVLARALEADGREPTNDERRVLNRFTGWGGLPQAFNGSHSDSGIRERFARLQEVLQGEEYEAARSSTNNAHFTPPSIIRGVWQAVANLGFKGGRVLDPSSGTGYFIGEMPKEIAERSTVTAIELEPTSARIAKLLYGKYGVRLLNQGFEAAKLPEDFFDLVISNVPFGNYQVPETRLVEYRNFVIHDYFFAKALEVVRPGGLVAFITSRFTLDKFNGAVREYLATKAELVGAIRLPNSAFKAMAGTSVTSDILLFRKNEATPSSNEAEPTWLQVPAAIPQEHKLRDTSEPWSQMYINQHYLEDSSWVIGKCLMDRTGYGKQDVTVSYQGDLAEALAERVTRLPKGIYVDRSSEIEVEPRSYFAANAEWVKPGAYVIHQGQVAVSHGEMVEIIEHTMHKSKTTRIAAMIPVRDALRRLLAAQVATEDDDKLDAYRLALSVAYDGFVKKHGYISDRMNTAVFRADPDFPMMLSLEVWEEDNPVPEKAAVFTRRTVGMVRKVERCETPEEALLVCLGERGRVYLPRIAELLEQPEADTQQCLLDAGLAFLDPETMNLVERDAYLSGNVRQRLCIVEAAGEQFAGNAEALRQVIPPDIGPGDISARLGATWVPLDVYADFIVKKLEINDAKVVFNKRAGTWMVSGPNYTVQATQTWGTNRVPALELMEMAMNQQNPQLTDRDENDPEGKRRVVNTRETIAANEKLQAQKEAFAAWLWESDERVTRMVRVYNDEFNSIVTRKYDGSHLRLPGFSMAYELRQHQKDGVWRIIASRGNTLLAHAVGAGKTLTMICGGMEMRRMGLASKPCFVVPNHMLEQFAAEFLRAYPTASVLLASKDDMTPANRKVMLSRIAMGDWDAVVITHASFERIKVPDDYIVTYIKGMIREQAAAIQMEQDSGNTRVVKQLERQKKMWEARLVKLAEGIGKDDLLSFDELGIDAMYVDEAHCFKNLYRFSRLRMPGLPTNDSMRAFDMYLKTRYVMEKRGEEKGVVFATGTPIANSVAEMWVMQAYLQPRLMNAMGLDQFDAWAANFGEPVTALELSPDGSSYRMHTRFARFINVPELMTMFREVADIRTAEMMKLPVPESIRETVTAKPSATLKAYVQELVLRAEAIKKGQIKDPSIDNMLKVTTDGRKAATDLRLIGIEEDDEGSKINLCVAKVAEIHAETDSFKGTQLVFMDMGTPTASKWWNLYSDMKQKLVAGGIPEAEIKFIHDAATDKAKEAMFKAVRQGKIRVLFGSTSKMGVGTNVQTRLVALHHVDGPWRPADVEQREGRIVRQGNTLRQVRLYRYVTEGSFDAYVWQTLETKARFIAQVMSGDISVRSIEDAELAALSYAEVKALASGNPLVIEKAGVDAEVMRLTMLQSKWKDQQWSNRWESADLPGRIRRYEDLCERMQRDVDGIVDTHGDFFRMVLAGQVYVDREEAGKRLLGAVTMARPGQLRTIGKIGKFSIDIDAPKSVLAPVKLLLCGEFTYEVVPTTSAIGTVRRLEHAQQILPREELVKADQRLVQYRTRQEDLQRVLNVPFEHHDRLQTLRVRKEEIDKALGIHEGEQQTVVDVELAQAA